MAARKSALRAVAPDEKPPPKRPAKPQTIAQAASGGSTRDVLVASRDRIARALDDPNIAARDLASNSKRLMEIIREIEAIDARAAEEGDGDAAEVQDGDFDASAV
jgi:hypothetical protein